MKSIYILTVATLLIGCASGTTGSFESALSALDNGDFDTAVTELESLATATVSDDLELSLLLSSAYAGRAGIDFLELAKTLLEDNNSDQAFQAIHSAFVQTIEAGTGLDDLLNAINALDDFTGSATGADEAERRYRLGLLQAIDAFARPTITAKPTAASTIDVSAITSKAQVQTSFLEGDNNLTNDGAAGGVSSSNQLVEVLRDSYCALKDISAADGFTVEELQDLTLCQLTAEPEDLVPADFSSSVTSCDDFDFGCTGADALNTSL